MSFDRLFKLALLAVLLGFLWVGWATRENGRYIYHPETEYGAPQIVDTRTGAVFMFSLSGDRSDAYAFIEVHPQTGETNVHTVWLRYKQASILENLLKRVPAKK